MPCRTNAGSCENHGDVTSAKDTSNQLVIDLDGDKGDNPAIELNHCFLTDVEVSHKQITDRFVELLNLFDSYTQIVVDEQNSNNNVKPIALRRSQSELMKRRDNQHEDLTKTSASLGNIKLSDLTLMPAKKSTCEVSIQTSRSLLKEKLMKLKPKWTEKLQQPNVQGYFIPKPQHTLHIEVESVSSATEFQRARLRVRLWKVITDMIQTMFECFYMIGDNFTYVLFVFFCMWCVYLLIEHYYRFLQGNVNQNAELKRRLATMSMQMK